jgi:hypothetical protein
METSFHKCEYGTLLIANQFNEKKDLCIPPREDNVKNEKYEGAYVKEPQLRPCTSGLFHLILTHYIHISLYNITYRQKKLLVKNSSGISVNKMLNHKATPLALS